MKRYSEYKDSGVKWIGEIPEHWKIEPFGRHFSYGKGLPITKADLVSEGVAVISYGQIHSKLNIGTTMDDCLLRYVDPKYIETNPQCLLNKNDFVFADTSEDIEGCGNFAFNDRNESIFAGYHTIIVRPIDILHPKYYAYLFQSKKWKSQVQTLVNGVKVFSISRGILKKASLLIPTYTEQQEIVTYLDTKVANIDEYISIAEKKIAALEELKQSIIAEAVTRGIHKEVPMKDSGVKWIGMIPEHWKIMRLRFVCEFRNGYTPSKANPKFWENGTIPWFRMEDIRDSGRFLNEAKQYISKEAVKGDGLFEAGSFILATTATIGEHAMLIADSLANQRFTNLKIRKSLISKLSRNFFFYYLFVIDEYCKSTTRKATFPSVDMTDLKNIGVSIPPIEEQQEIVTYLDSKVANINQLCQAERSQIEKLKEYKQRLISDVVTGKVKVTND